MKEVLRWTLCISAKPKTNLNGKHIVFIILQVLKEPRCYSNSWAEAEGCSGAGEWSTVDEQKSQMAEKAS